MYVSLDGSAEIVDDKFREERRTKKTGLLSWLKPRVCKMPFATTKCYFMTELLTSLCVFGSPET